MTIGQSGKGRPLNVKKCDDMRVMVASSDVSVEYGQTLKATECPQHRTVQAMTQISS